MLLYEEMRLKKTSETVRVYKICEDGKTARIFSPSLYQQRDNGWDVVKISSLVPIDFPVNSSDYTSKTRRNKAKSRMKIIDALWQTSDGVVWNHKNIDEAIEYEVGLMDKEESEATAEEQVNEV